MVGERALKNERDHGTPLCKSLERALDREHMTNWIASFLRMMVHL
jgi:hypothetical protein